MSAIIDKNFESEMLEQILTQVQYITKELQDVKIEIALLKASNIRLEKDFDTIKSELKAEQKNMVFISELYSILKKHWFKFFLILCASGGVLHQVTKFFS